MERPSARKTKQKQRQTAGLGQAALPSSAQRTEERGTNNELTIGERRGGLGCLVSDGHRPGVLHLAVLDVHQRTPRALGDWPDAGPGGDVDVLVVVDDAAHW